MGVITDLIGQGLSQKQQSAQQDAQDIGQQLQMFNYVLQDPDAPVPLKEVAHQKVLGLVQKHGGKQAREALPMLGQYLTRLAAPSIMQGMKQQQQRAAVQDQFGVGRFQPSAGAQFREFYQQPDQTPVTSPAADTSAGQMSPEQAGQLLTSLGQGTSPPEMPTPSEQATRILQQLGLASSPPAMTPPEVPPGRPPYYLQQPPTGMPPLLERPPAQEAEAAAGEPAAAAAPGLRRTSLAQLANYRLPPINIPGPQGFRQKLGNVLIALSGQMPPQAAMRFQAMADRQRMMDQTRLGLFQQQQTLQFKLQQIDAAEQQGLIPPEQAQRARTFAITGEREPTTRATRETLQQQMLDDALAAKQQDLRRPLTNTERLQVEKDVLLAGKQTPTERLPARLAERRKIDEIIENKDGKYSEPEVADAKKEKQYMDAQVDQAVDRAQVQARQAAGGKDIVAGTPEFQIAQDLAYGKLTFQDFRTIYSYSRNEQKREAIYLKARELNPSFNPAEFEAGYKFAARPQTRQQLASLDNVESGVNDLLRLSDAAQRSGATILNQFVSPGGYAIGNRNFTSFQAARIAFADELSGALGYGSATDMSRAMGFDMTDPNLSPENFRRNIEGVIWPFLNRKRDSLLNEMGPYGEPERQRAEDVGKQAGLTREGLPRPSKEGARPTPALVKRYYEYYKDRQKAKDAMRAAGWAVD